MKETFNREKIHVKYLCEKVHTSSLRHEKIHVRCMTEFILDTSFMFKTLKHKSVQLRNMKT